MAHIRVMHVMQMFSGLPEDRIVNVFHFRGDGDYDTEAPLARARVAAFFNTASGTNSVSYYISALVLRTSTVTSYDLDEPKPRVPTSAPVTLTAAGSLNGFPEEVACCLSYHSSVPPAITARRRGRVYIGPLNGTAVHFASTEAPARPETSFIADLAASAGALVAAGAVDPKWCVRSSLPTENFQTINGGWIDNALDTQRRRGPDATSRTTWGVVPV